MLIARSPLRIQLSNGCRPNELLGVGFTSSSGRINGRSTWEGFWTMKHFGFDELKFVYSSEHEPIGSVAPGERFVVDTEDCFTGRFRTPEGFTEENLSWVLDNLDGVTGPIHVEGATVGKVVAITLHEVEILGVGSVAWSKCEAASTNDWWQEWYAVDGLKIVDGCVVFHDVSIPVAPLVGCVATAPERETILSKMQGYYGGNLDCSEVSEGATIVLPVSVDGALLYFGDSKARMGDGEIVQAPEVSTRLTMSVEVRDRPSGMNWPRIESDTHLTTVVSARTIDDAAGIAFAEMLAWSKETSGMSRQDTAMILGMIADVGICQTANSLPTAKCKVERSLLPWDSH